MHSVKSLLGIYFVFFLCADFPSYTADFACICFEILPLLLWKYAKLLNAQQKVKNIVNKIFPNAQIVV